MRREFHHNSDEQVREYVEKALTLVEDLDPPEDLRPLVLNNAISLYSAKQVVLEQVQPTIGLLGQPGR